MGSREPILKERPVFALDHRCVILYDPDVHVVFVRVEVHSECVRLRPPAVVVRHVPPVHLSVYGIDHMGVHIFVEMVRHLDVSSSVQIDEDVKDGEMARLENVFSDRLYLARVVVEGPDGIDGDLSR
ncbi:MAG TPA: hypothetical protein HA349_04090 [Methanotrichaceae archaeon]|nr:hypothetical protein [Methanotrichaceae archaeon]